jgi:hypothetical protein
MPITAVTPAVRASSAIASMASVDSQSSLMSR